MELCIRALSPFRGTTSPIGPLTVAAKVTLAIAVLCWAAPWAGAQAPPRDPEPAKTGPADGPGPKAAPAPKLGLHVNEPGALQGYTLVAPMNSTKTYLIDMQGRVVKEWKSDYTPAMCAWLLENGNLLRPATAGRGQGFGAIPGAGGRVQEFTWDGELVWDYHFQSDKYQPHHDICRLPNGNVILVCTDKKTSKEAIAAGRRPELVGDSFLPDCLIEIKRTGKTTGEVVWQWHLWDHLVQDYDKSKPGYGSVAEHPELVNINYGEDVLAPIQASKDGADKLRSIGYVGTARRGRNNPDWTHTNSVAYNPELDQLVLSIHNFSEVWIIYVAPKKQEFFSMLISGAQRLPNGNTLICSGVNGTIFEVTPESETV